MPTYEYVCPDCGHSETVFHDMTASVRIVCPDCIIEKHPYLRDEK